MNEKLYKQDDIDDLQNIMHDIKLLINPSDEAEFFGCDIVSNALDSLIKPQLTLEELRDQFEERHNWENSSWHKSSYANGTVQIQWESYISCAKANNILREG